MAQSASANGILVVLNIYDLHSSNAVFHWLGSGFYHTGVEVGKVEYSFSGCGVTRVRPRSSSLGTFREAIVLGQFVESGPGRSVKTIVKELGSETFAPGKYDILNRNCNHFTSELVRILVGASIPPWVNRLAEMGTSLSIPSSIFVDEGPSSETPSRTSTESSETSTEQRVAKVQQQVSTAVSWMVSSGMSLAAITTTTVINVMCAHEMENQVEETEVHVIMNEDLSDDESI